MQRSARFSRVTWFLATLVSATACQAPRGSSDETGRLPVDDRSLAVDALLEPNDLPDGPGGVIGVYQDGEVVYARGFGLANLEYEIPNTPTTVFRVGSVSKQFVGLAIALLAQRGEIDLDDDIREYFPEIPKYPEGAVTIRHLVHHTSGMRDYNELATLAGYRSDQLATTEATFEMLARQRGLNFRPGDQYLYSNSGYFLMGVLVKRVTGKTMAEFAREEIFTPLGMEQSLFKDDHRAVVPNRAYGYVEQGDGWGLYLSQRDFVGAGGVFTTVEDMLSWFVNLDDNRLGAPGLMEVTHQTGILNDGASLEYAFGLTVDEDRELPRVHHSGSFAAFRAHSIRYPEQGLAVFTAVNGGDANPVRLAVQAADIYLRALVPALPSLQGPQAGGQPSGTVDDPHPPLQVDGSTLQAYAGSYYGPELDVTYEILEQDGGIAFRLSGQEAVPLRAMEDGRFRGGRVSIRFHRTGGTVGTGFTLDGSRVRGLEFARGN